MIRSSVWVVFNNFLLLDATDRSKISSDQKRLFFDVSLYPLSFFVNTPFKSLIDWLIKLMSRPTVYQMKNAERRPIFNCLVYCHRIQTRSFLTLYPPSTKLTVCSAVILQYTDRRYTGCPTKHDSWSIVLNVVFHNLRVWYQRE